MLVRGRVTGYTPVASWVAIAGGERQGGWVASWG